MKEDLYHRPIASHSGNKYVRTIHDVDSTPDAVRTCRVDVYKVIVAFGVTCPGVQHALKKLLCAGLRDKGGRTQDLREAMDALFRAIQEAELAEAEGKKLVDDLSKTLKGSVAALPGGGVAISYKVDKVAVPVPPEMIKQADAPAYEPCPKCESPRAADKSCSVCGYGAVQEAKP